MNNKKDGIIKNVFRNTYGFDFMSSHERTDVSVTISKAFCSDGAPSVGAHAGIDSRSRD
jgi:hypothetical protein